MKWIFLLVTALLFFSCGEEGAESSDSSVNSADFRSHHPFHLTTDSNDNLFLVGYVSDGIKIEGGETSVSYYEFVRKLSSSDSSATWDTQVSALATITAGFAIVGDHYYTGGCFVSKKRNISDGEYQTRFDYSHTDVSESSGYRYATALGTDVYFVGNAGNETTNKMRIQKLDTVTETMTEVYIESGTLGLGRGPIVSSGSRVIATVNEEISGSNFVNALVLLSDDNGANWSRVDFNFSGCDYLRNQELIVGENANELYALMSAEDDCAASFPNSGGWIVAKSTDNGDSWSIVDQFAVERYSVFSAAYPKDIVLAPNGDLYVLGTSTDYRSNDVQSWSESAITIRKSTDSGATWSTIYHRIHYSDDLTKWSVNPSTLGINSQGHLWVAGFQHTREASITSGTTETTDNKVIIMKSTDSGVTWAVEDQWTRD